MGVDRTNDTTIRSQAYVSFLRSHNMEFWSQITGLDTFNPSRQRAKHIVHPCWRTAHHILNTSIFGRLEPGQINRCELFFLYCMRHREESDFSTFLIYKCEAVRQRITGDIHIGGLITIIGRVVGLNFPAPDYLSVDHYQPNFLLDCYALERAKMLDCRGNEKYNWLDGDKHPVYILPSWVSNSFEPNDPKSSGSIDSNRYVTRL
jgi:hypothetical protein